MSEPEVSQGRYKRIFGVLFQLTKLVNSGVPLPTFLKAVAAAAVDLTSAQTCTVMLLDESRTELLNKAGHGLSAQQEVEIRFRMGEGVAGWVAEHNQPALIADVNDDERFVKVAGQATPIQSMLCVPLHSAEGVIGTLTLTADQKGKFGPDHVELMTYLGSSVVKDIENARLFRLSVTDLLTKAFNRQYLFQRLPQEVERAKRYSAPLSLVLFDLDRFKALNERIGRAGGDFVLKEMARVVQHTIRDVDTLVRYGGEEFLVLLPSTELAGARITADRIHKAVEAMTVLWGQGEVKASVSAVAVQLDANDTDESLLKRAELALEDLQSRLPVSLLPPEPLK